MATAYKRMIAYIVTSAHSGLFAVGAFKPLTGDNNGVQLAPFLTQAFSGSGGGLVELFNGAFRFAIAIGAILAVVRLVYAGFKYMTTDLFGAKNDAKEIIWNALIGLFLLLSIWIILNQINPRILDLNILQSAAPR
jgi:hypothetical protein